MTKVKKENLDFQYSATHILNCRLHSGLSLLIYAHRYERNELKKKKSLEPDSESKRFRFFFSSPELKYVLFILR